MSKAKRKANGENGSISTAKIQASAIATDRLSAHPAIKLDPQQAGILQTLLAEKRAVDEKIAYFMRECADKKGVDLNDYGLNLATMTFVPKPPAPKVIVQ